jgi:predicted RNA-binding Zn-ribbon protein involved in translation (DUF1610 family)
MPEDRDEANQEEVFEFDCPECGRHIVEIGRAHV